MDERARRWLQSPHLPALLLLAGWALAALGYWGAWIWAAPVGLRVPGIDLAEYVKFMAVVRSGQVRLTREIFLLPLIAISLSMSLLAHRGEMGFPKALRWIVNFLAIPVALSMLPPAWTPSLITTPEFVKQTVAIAVCVVAALLSYALRRRLPLVVSAAVVASLALLSILFPLANFFKLRAPFEAIYGHSVALGTGPIFLSLGLLLIATAPLLLLFRRGRHYHS